MTSSGRYPFLIRAAGRVAGFALVRVLHRDGQTEMQMAEFFIVRKYRRQGAGETAARRAFDQFPGRWVVAVMDRNVPAQRFWRAVVKRYIGDAITERHDDGRVVQDFVIPG